jgi:hypothetical protein
VLCNGVWVNAVPIEPNYPALRIGAKQVTELPVVEPMSIRCLISVRIICLPDTECWKEPGFHKNKDNS